MIKTLKTTLKQDEERYAIPRKVQDVIPIRRIWPDGIFQVGAKFSRTYKFSDINYLVASREDKEAMFLAYSELLNSLDSGATTKLTINNRRLNKANFEQSILMPMRGDQRDVYRKEYNQMLLDKATDANGIMQEKYVTITVAKKDIEEARSYFFRVGADLTARFAVLGSKCVELDAAERLRILHDFYRQGEEADFHFDLHSMMQKGHDVRDYICPDSIEKFSDHLKLGEKFCRVLFLKDYASYIKDSMVTELTDLNRNMMLSIDVIPIPTDEAVREVENRLLGVETNITNWQRKQNQNNNFSAVVPYDMELQRKESKEFLEDLTTRDQRMMFAVLTLVLTADSWKQLQSDTEMIQAIARKNMCQLATLKFQQIDGLNTVLPIGTRKIDAFRTLTTESLAVLMPFKVQEIQDRDGIYFGENAISHNLIMCNKENLLNQSAFLLGVPGSGKSFSAKELISFLMLNTEDDILICDPENEFAPLVEAMGSDIGTVINVSAGGKDRLNAMYMVEGYGENNPIVEKSQFIMSLVEQIDKNGVGPQHKSIIDRCTAMVYQEAARNGSVPTLCTLREKLLEQPEPQAKEIALALELYTTGSLDIFGHPSTVNMDKRVVVFNIHDLGEQLKPAGLLVITDTMINRVTLNWKKGKRTHVFIDEFHVVFENENSGNFFNSAWRQFRKRNAFPTAITQNVEYLLNSVQASTMLSNSEFVVMLNQAPADREKLARLLNISREQMSYITNADAGCGLIKYGSTLVPFINRFPKDTQLYKLMTTKPGEGVFGGEQGGEDQVQEHRKKRR
ncbi:MAG: TraE family protein [Oscillospiraceae bacterium]|nr:TraE family protein [Oscillospiraceae bacterium]